MNQKNLNKNITGTQVDDAAESTMQQDKDKFSSYKFEIMEDDNIYSISFRGKLADEETKKMLESIQNCLYEKTADCIQTYLEQNNIAYSGFVSSKMPLNHNKTMELAELLLHSDGCSGFDSYFGNTDTCYLIADHQQWTTENCCHGCYFAVKRTFSESENLYRHNIIGQTFNYNEINGDENGYFAIRESKDNEALYNIAVSASGPVLPAFGCIDILGILLNIDNIQAIEQIEKIAVK